MKVTKENLTKMADMITILLSHTMKHDVNQKDIDFVANDISFLHLVWGKVVNNIKFDSTNANVIAVNGQRMFQQDENFDYYIDGTNDNTIETALKYIFKNLIKPIKKSTAEVKRITDL